MNDVQNAFEQWREKAEGRIGDGSRASAEMSREEMAKALHELEVYQIELELQNEELRKTQESLAISRDRFALLFHQAPVGYLVLNANGIILDANETFCRMIGMEADRIVSRGLNDFLVEDGRRAFLARYRSFYNSPAGKHMEFSLRTESQDQIWVRMSGARLKPVQSGQSEESENSDILVTLIDITDRLQAQRALDSQLVQLDAILDILQHPFTDLQAFQQFILQKAAQLTTSRYGILMHRWGKEGFLTTVWPPEIMDECPMNAPLVHIASHPEGFFAELINRKEPLVLNDLNPLLGNRIRFPQGHLSISRMLCHPVLISGELVAVVALAGKPMDYTPADVLQVSLIMENAWKVVDRETALIQLQEREEQYRTLTENSQDSIMRFDKDCRHIFVNSAALRITRLQREDFLGKTHREMGFPSELCDLWESAIQAVFTEKRIQEREFSWDGPEGRIVFDWRLFPEMDEKGNVLSVVSVARDITKWRKAEAERDRMRLQLIQQQKMETVGRLAGGIAHDFNNKLQAILGYTDMAIEDAADDGQVVADLQSIRNVSMNLADLVRQLLAYASRQMVSPRILDLNETISGMTGMVRRLIGEHIRLEWASTPDLWRVKIDPGQVDQMLMHVCLNARDAIRGNGAIAIRVENVTLQQADCAAHAGRAPGEYVMISVSDTGEGIDPAMLEHIFEPFFTSKDIDKGKGLGLAVIYGIARQNGGFAEVESQLHKGTTLRIFLPRCTESDQPAGLAEIRDTARATILLVEDDADILDIGRQILNRMGYTVLVAQSPEEAISRAEASPGPIDLLVTDVIMPEMNGRVLSERLKRKFPEMRIIFMSGYTSDIMGSHGMRNEEFHFLQKPFTVNAFMTKVAQVLKAAVKQPGDEEARS